MLVTCPVSPVRAYNLKTDDKYVAFSPSKISLYVIYLFTKRSVTSTRRMASKRGKSRVTAARVTGDSDGKKSRSYVDAR